MKSLLATRVHFILLIVSAVNFGKITAQLPIKSTKYLLNFDENGGGRSGQYQEQPPPLQQQQQQQTSNAAVIETISSAASPFYTNFCPPKCACLDDYFECKKMNLKTVPNLPSWVRSLELTGNRLDDNVELTIGYLTELISLNLKKNRLHKIPVFIGLNSLERLNLAHNKIQAINVEALLTLPVLKELDLSKNALVTILPNSIPVKNSLNILNLNNNRLKSLEEKSLDNLHQLQELNLAHNSLKQLPHGIFESLSYLKKLDLSGNELNITWSTFRGLDGVRTLKLRANGIDQLPDGVFHALKSIVLIDLDSNRIEAINRRGFYNLTTLTALSLVNNSIEKIEIDTWEYTQQLLQLDLSSNRLTEVTQKNFDYLQRLRKLSLAENRIRHVQEGAFNCTRDLEQLDLSGNQLSWTIEESFSPTFLPLHRLQRLSLNRNGLKTIAPKAFLGLTSLQQLSLSDNNFTTIQFNAFEPIQEKLQKLTLNSTHFLCDCNLQWLHKWLKEFAASKSTTGIGVGNSSPISTVSVICDYPIGLRGRNLLQLKEEDFMCKESPKPRLIKEPSNQLAIKGTNLTLECSAISSLAGREMSVQWRRDNLDVQSSENFELKSTLAANNSTIISSYWHLQNVQHEHTGRYQCVVTNSFGTTYSQRFKITVATYPEFRKIPINVTLNAGSTARLDCSADGEPQPQIAWQKDGGNDFPAARERRMHVMPTDDAFFIINAKITDMGVYTCTAENPAGIIKVNATLTVYERPTFVRPMESKEVQTGISSVLECMTSGSPKPILRWYKDGQPIQITERHFYAAEGQLLIIVDTIPSDAGIYKCEIENNLGIESGYLTLKVDKTASSKNVVNVEEMTGIVIITVFCCAVGTSIIWVVIIYQTKKTGINNASGSGGSGDSPADYRPASAPATTVTNTAATTTGAFLNDPSAHCTLIRNGDANQNHSFKLLPQTVTAENFIQRNSPANSPEFFQRTSILEHSIKEEEDDIDGENIQQHEQQQQMSNISLSSSLSSSLHSIRETINESAIPLLCYSPENRPMENSSAVKNVSNTANTANNHKINKTSNLSSEIRNSNLNLVNNEKQEDCSRSIIALVLNRDAKNNLVDSNFSLNNDETISINDKNNDNVEIGEQLSSNNIKPMNPSSSTQRLNAKITAKLLDDKNHSKILPIIKTKA